MGVGNLGEGWEQILRPLNWEDKNPSLAEEEALSVRLSGTVRTAKPKLFPSEIAEVAAIASSLLFLFFSFSHCLPYPIQSNLKASSLLTPSPTTANVQLRYRQTDHVFSPAVIRFYLAEIVCALHHLHTMGIAYRDLKPENVLIQQSGHVTLTDFDLSRKLSHKTVKTFIAFDDSKVPETRRKLRRWGVPLPLADANRKGSLKNNAKTARVSPVSRRRPSLSDGERSNSFVGTEEYVAPEVVRGDGHEFAVDWWALGVLTYEMLYGTTPFKGKNRKETFRNVLVKAPEFVGRRTALTDLIERLLEKDPTRRLGYVRGASEIREHEFFRGVKWDLLTEVVRPPFIPSREDASLTADKFAAGGNITEYFKRLKSPPSLPPSPLPSPSSEFQRSVSFAEF